MTPAPFPFVGNLLWIDFVNTEPVREGVRVDLLTRFDDLARWLRESGALPADAARRSLGRWGGTAEGRGVLREARRLRTALRAGGERLAAGKPAGEAMVAAVNRVLATRPAYPQLIRAGRGYVSRLEPAARSPQQLLVPVAESAAWLLERGEAAMVRRCEGTRCVLLFYDTTRNRSRRWCSMAGCGSRAKAAAYYRRSKGGKRNA